MTGIDPPGPGGTGLDVENQRLHSAVRAGLFGEREQSLQIGRFDVLEKIGEGGMGVVYAARDKELDRKVAIKLLRSNLRGSGSQGRSRLLREAQAMAKLSHPNVVPVFEVGEHDGQVYVAMEFVTGQTLSDWLKGEHDRQAILEIFRQAGHGLAAAHAAGIIHRDFKPANAIVGEDGRVRVLDFGLARPSQTLREGASTGPQEPVPPSDGDIGGFETPLTETGTVMGTPAYMSPEQFLGGTADGRSDQFSFCIAVWEALCGERPFAGKSRAALHGNVTAGKMREPASTMPQWIARLLRRGLEVNPAARYPSMDALLDDLGNDPAQRRRRRLIGAGVVLAVAGAGAVGYSQARPAFESRCAPAEERLADIWDDGVKQRLAARFVDPEQPHVAASWASLERLLDDWTARWTELYQRACTDLDKSGASASATEVQRLSCLDERHQWLETQVESLTNDDPFAIANVHSGDIYSFASDLWRCDTDAAVQSQPSPPADNETRAKVRELIPRMVRTEMLLHMGRHKEALALAEEIAETAESLGHSATLADALMLLADAQSALELEAADSTVDRALLAAEAGRYDVMAAVILGNQLYREHAKGNEAAVEAIRGRLEAAIERAGSPPVLQHRVLGLEQVAAEQADDLPRAHEAELKMRAQTEKDHGRQSALAAYGDFHVAISAAERLQDFDQSLELGRRALARLEELLGPEHPELCGVLGLNGTTLRELGRWGESTAQFERMVRILTRVYPDGNPILAMAYFDLAQGHLAQGRVAQAVEHAERSEAMVAELFGPSHSQALSGPTAMLAVHRWNVGDFDRARESIERILSSERVPPSVRCRAMLVRTALQARDRDAEAVRVGREQSIECWEGADDMPPEHRDRVAATWSSIVDAELGNASTARTEADRALELIRSEDPKTQPQWQVRELEALAGHLRLADGDAKDARAVLEPAVGSLDDCCNEFFFAPVARFALAQALWETRGDRKQALSLARKAAAGFAKLGPGRDQERKRVEAWLNQR